MDENYRSAVEEIKQVILQSQYQALKGVNRIQLSLYFNVGKYVSENTRTEKWGTGAIDEISSQLRKELPGLRGFSATSIKRMRIFYEEWEAVLPKSSTMANDLKLGISSTAVDELKTEKSSTTTDDLKNENLSTAVDELQGDKSFIVVSDLRTDENDAEFPIDAFMQVPFTHHYIIVSKVKNYEERVFYLKLCAEEHLSKDALTMAIQNNDFKHQGSMPNNFATSIMSAVQAKKAIMAFKDEYMLDFINVEELGERDKDVNERVVENAIVHNIKNFIMTFGRDFAFLGNQYHVEAMGHDHYIDLLFFNRELSCLVAIELKTGAFKPIYLGELNTYLQVLDDFVRKPNENPSVGIVLCRNADKAYAEYAVRDYNKPMGVATYKTASDMPERLRNALPDLEDLKKLLERGDNEL